jgi:hypothetical protein
MAEEEVKKTEEGEVGDATDDGTSSTDTSDGGDGEESQSKKKLEESSNDELIAYVKELRAESKARREENTDLKKLVEEVPGLKEKLKELEDKDKSEEDLKTERLMELEAAAERVPLLEKYQAHVKAAYLKRMKEVKEMGDAVKEPIESLLEDMPKDDFLGRLKIVNAVLSVSGSGRSATELSEGDEGSPAETGTGDASRSVAKDLAWSPMGQSEAELAGLTKQSE